MGKHRVAAVPSSVGKVWRFTAASPRHYWIGVARPPSAGTAVESGGSCIGWNKVCIYRSDDDKGGTTITTVLTSMGNGTDAIVLLLKENKCLLFCLEYASVLC